MFENDRIDMVEEIKYLYRNDKLVKIASMYLTLTEDTKLRINNQLIEKYDININTVLPKCLKKIGDIGIYRGKKNTQLIISNQIGQSYFEEFLEEYHENIDFNDVFLNDRFFPFYAINQNLILINDLLQKINSCNFYITGNLEEEDFLLIKPFSYLNDLILVLINFKKLIKLKSCPNCNQKYEVIQYFKVNKGLVTICKECSHIINLEEGF